MTHREAQKNKTGLGLVDMYIVYKNLIGTLLSSPCQLRLGGCLSYLRLRYYIRFGIKV